MKNQIKKVVTLPESSINPDGSKVTWYHVYTQVPGFGVEPKGALVEQRELNGNSSYSIKPLGFSNSNNVLYGTPSLQRDNNSNADFFNWFRGLNQNEVRNIVQGRSLLFG